MKDELHAALSALQSGHLVVVPTDTVYGVAAVPDAPGAIGAIFRAKGRPVEKAIPVLGADGASLATVALFDDRAKTLAERFWPGPLTLVLARTPAFRVDLGGRDSATVAVRVPNSSITRSLLALSGPLAVTSANLSGETAATTVGEARAALGDAVSVYLDEGPCTQDPSTIVSLVAEPRVLRSGALEPDVLALL